MSCPICNKPAATDYQPFCSKRCADVDLAKWLNGAYTIPGGPADDEEPPTPQDEPADRLH